MSTISHDTLIRLSEEGFAHVTALAASHKPGCVLARKHLAEAERDGLDTCAHRFVERVGMTGGWVDRVYGGPRIGTVPRIAPLY